MAQAKHWYLISYDIRDPKRWRRAYKLLQGYGESMQLSIFSLCIITAGTGAATLGTGKDFDGGG